MTHKLFLTLILFLSCVYVNANIMLYPKYIFLNSKNKSEKVHLVNTDAAQSAKYRISLKSFKQKHDGGFTEGDAQKAQLYSNIKYSPRRAQLGPKQQQTIKVLAFNFDNLPDGDSAIYLAIAKIPDDAPLEPQNPQAKGISINLTAIHEVALPVIVRKGIVNDKGQISNITKTKDFKTTPALQMRLQRVPQKDIAQGIVRGDISVWYKNKLLSFIKGKYVLPDNDYVDITLSIATLSDILPKAKWAGANLTVLFTVYEDNNTVEWKNILNEATFAL